MFGSMRLPGKPEFYQMRPGAGWMQRAVRAARDALGGSVVREGRGGSRGLALRLLPVAVTLHVIARHVFARQTETAGVLAQEAPHEDRGRQITEALLLDRLEIGATGLGLVGSGFTGQFHAFVVVSTV